MAKVVESETCGTCGRFARDTETDDSGACFDTIYRVCSGRWAYAMVTASGRACGEWVQPKLPDGMCAAVEKQSDGLCLGYGTANCDEPCEACKRCEQNTTYGTE